MRAALSTLAELLGIALVVAAAVLVDYRLGMAMGGVALVLLGFAMGSPGERPTE